MAAITILDFTTGEVHIHPFPSTSDKSAEEFVEHLGYKTSDCQYMTSSELRLTIHPTK